jgi:hypothetical protein
VKSHLTIAIANSVQSVANITITVVIVVWNADTKRMIVFAAIVVAQTLLKPNVMVAVIAINAATVMMIPKKLNQLRK